MCTFKVITSLLQGWQKQWLPQSNDQSVTSPIVSGGYHGNSVAKVRVYCINIGNIIVNVMYYLKDGYFEV